MKTLTNKTYTGRKARVGGICFDERGRLHFFVGYCNNCRGRILMPKDEAMDFTNKFRTRNKSIKTRMLLKLLDEHTI